MTPVRTAWPRLLSATLALTTITTAAAQGPTPTGGPGKRPIRDAFRQLEEILPTPNAERTASGAPAPGYWQQRCDYEIDVVLDDENQRLTGNEKLTYHNRSPHELRYLWLQLDGNIFEPDSTANLTRTAPNLAAEDGVDFVAMRRLLAAEDFHGGFNITSVRDADDRDLQFVVVQTMMRVDLPQPLAPGATFTFAVDWNYAINPSARVRGRAGAEHFAADDNWLYEVAQWFPRMCAYTDVTGWHHKQFLGRGEFTLEFGDYVVRITAPADHIVASTGELQNPEEVLTDAQRDRLERARTASEPIFVVTPDEARATERADRPARSDTKTWIYRAENVRDFAWASSAKFIWDAQGHEVGGNRVLAMSYYPNEGEPLWSRYSTHAIIHTLDVYSRYTFDYPYPVAISVNGPVGGMEYPMICFNGPRPEPDGTYTKRTKYGLISVIIHEVGHNYFPMIVNSDERQWTWMDEGLNTFVQFLTEQEWEPDYPSRRGEARKIVGYMASENQVPIMTNSESIPQFGPNAYAKPATALNILRETILGRDLFDFAFQEYSRRWRFKRPMPADFFRTMEDASGIDLDWFWRGWFYSTDHCDLAITDVRPFRIDSRDPEREKAIAKADRATEPTSPSATRNASLPKRTARFPGLLDFYNRFDELDVTPHDRRDYERLLDGLDADEKTLLAERSWFHLIDLANVGGLVMPVLLRIELADGSTRELRIPAEIWRYDPERVTKLVRTEQPIANVTLDPQLETADVDLTNNHWPPRRRPSRFKLFKQKKRANPMQRAATAPDSAAGGGQGGGR